MLTQSEINAIAQETARLLRETHTLEPIPATVSRAGAMRILNVGERTLQTLKKMYPDIATKRGRYDRQKCMILKRMREGGR